MIAKNKLIAIVAFLIMVFISILNLFIPQVIRSILDDAISKEDRSLLINLIIIYILISISLALLNVILEYIYSKMNKKLGINLRLRLLSNISKLSGDYYANIKTGNILNIIENDVFMIENFGIDVLFSLIVDIIMALVALFFLIHIQKDLLVIIIVIQIVLLFSQSKITKLIVKKTSEVRNDSGNISNLVQEYISNIMNVIISKGCFTFFKKYICEQRNFIKKCIKLDIIISTNTAITNILNSLIIIFIYGYGGMKIMEGDMTLGNLIAFQQYTAMLVGPCLRIIKSNTRLQQSIVSLSRIFDIIDEPINIRQKNEGTKYVNNFNGKIVFNGVYFSYDKKLNVLNDLNLQFEEGHITALVGTSGCGKSTIINLLFRLWNVDKGEIVVDNIPLNDYNLKNIRKNIAIVTQDLLLFDDTIINNLILNNININKDVIIDICKKVDIYDFINKLPNQFETLVGERGIKLSGGQRQRISIVRALLSDSKIIVFDEATSALDNISQKYILENISQYLRNKTTIIIAHRLSTIKDADKIYVINKGQIVEEGTHKELIIKKKYYYNLLNEQNLDNSTT